jgi:hypothetical protein
MRHIGCSFNFSLPFGYSFAVGGITEVQPNPHNQNWIPVHFMPIDSTGFSFEMVAPYCHSPYVWVSDPLHPGGGFYAPNPNIIPVTGTLITRTFKLVVVSPTGDTCVVEKEFTCSRNCMPAQFERAEMAVDGGFIGGGGLVNVNYDIPIDYAPFTPIEAYLYSNVGMKMNLLHTITNPMQFTGSFGFSTLFLPSSNVYHLTLEARGQIIGVTTFQWDGSSIFPIVGGTSSGSSGSSSTSSGGISLEPEEEEEEED